MAPKPKPEAELTEQEDTRDGQAPTPTVPPRRINVAVSPEMLAAIDRVIERESVTLTEAVRRLIAYGDFIYQAVKEDKQSIILRSQDDGGEREIVLV